MGGDRYRILDPAEVNGTGHQKLRQPNGQRVKSGNNT